MILHFINQKPSFFSSILQIYLASRRYNTFTQWRVPKMITESKFKNILAPIITYFKKTDINSRGLADPNNFAWHARFLLQSARLPDSSSTASLTPKILRYVVIQRQPSLSCPFITFPFNFFPFRSHFKPLAEVISQNFEIYRRRPILEGSALLTQALHDVCCLSNVQFIIELIMDNP